ncbi:fimbrial protein [Vespertiliibacter pulmonis]|uniref:Protein transport protein HofC n=2 Tax=Vespertiliibacter pulmonis TaxID=1443036 RepID=A0A3N4W857_9PAST|nr:fimbrial protein [Vespertiliibacter pulmonis]RPE85717.1 protein transport protein HofC [Vespertiliibacter pulmonis]
MIYEYYWKAVNRFGKKQKGKCLAESREQLEQSLQQKGYAQLTIKRNFIFPKTPTNEEITQILNQITLLLNTTIPLNTALAMILQNCNQIRVYQWLKLIIQYLETGFTLSQSIEKIDKYLTTQEIQLIRMGEASGQLAIILSKLVKSRNKTEKLQKKIKKILFYPVIVLIISLSLSLLLLIFIVPQFAELYGEKQKSLPLITDILFTTSSFLTENTYTILAISIIMSTLIFILSKKTHYIILIKQFIFSHLPIFKHIINYNRIIFFCQNCALMLQSQLRLDVILKSFLYSKKSDPILYNEVQSILQLLQQGYRFCDGLDPTIFGNNTIQMITIGEKSGKLAEMLEHISEIYQQQLDYQIDLLSQLLEPILMLIMGIIVGTIIIGLYLPIFDMGTLVE